MTEAMITTEMNVKTWQAGDMGALADTLAKFLFSLSLKHGPSPVNLKFVLHGRLVARGLLQVQRVRRVSLQQVVQPSLSL